MQIFFYECDASLFQSLLTALLYKRPENPVEYIEKCLQTAKITKNLEWDSFLDIAYPEKGNSNEAKLKEDVKGAYEMIFKTEPKSEQKASS